MTQTRTAVFVRRVDSLLLIRPDKTLGLNHSGAAILEALYGRRSGGAQAALDALAPELGVDPARLLSDAEGLLDTVRALMSEDFSDRPMLRRTTFDRDMVRYPTLAEIALTYGCQNRCHFCYAASPHREGEHHLMTSEQVERVMDRIFHEGHVPSLSFTGGEATLRPDLPRLIRYGERLGFRVNLITNGLRAAEPGFAAGLVDAGLASAQVSLEAGDAAVHDEVVGKEGAFEATVAGVRAFRDLGIHVHTNSTLCARNLDHAPDLVRFVARDLGLPTLSMNMVIRTGGGARGDAGMELTYAEVTERIPALQQVAADEGVRLVWYSPVPYCLFNPVLHDLGAKACACVDGILSVDPSGQVLPCSSFAEGIGSLLEQPYDKIRGGRAARYWRRREYLPPPCEGCEDRDLCAGACPLYWDAAGSFAELPRPRSDDPALYRRWQRQRRRGRSFGVPAPQPDEEA